MEKPLARGQKQRTEANKYNVNFWAMLQNVLIASLNKGQLLIGFVGFILLISVLKMSGKDIKELMLQLINVFKSFYMLGWILAFVTTIASVYLLRRVKKLQLKDYERLNR